MAWFPHNKYIWDFWLTWDKHQQLHLFYLQAPQLECQFNPDNRHDRASVGHAILTDWGWQEVCTEEPILARSLEQDAWDDLSIWTGSIIQSPLDDRYYLFYTSRRKADHLIWTPHEWQRSQNIGVAVSDDLDQWHRLGTPNRVIPNPGPIAPFDGVNWRDPYVIYNADDQQFYAFICAHTQGEAEAGGIIAYVTAPNLIDWSPQPQILMTSHDFYQMEVPQLFWRITEEGTKRLYLLFCAQAKDCSRHWRQQGKAAQTGTYYRVSRPLPIDHPVDYQTIPWQGDAELLVEGFYAGKLIWKFTDAQTALTLQSDTIVKFLGFQWSDQADRFVGGISDPMPVRFQADGAIVI
jgi:beta-fructofuranosidase